ncbi:hypothetical protein BCR39DRAFT_563941 [Naematelia encephala]|uniref:VTT domain-containing protein n=1 Tax=Naematelia encephala TaxID=71784 RepID=A0A1Y2BF17_9TREE|nr:hypothetical protein BCR39DRAFT_563941 [Naematelia encephala]
MPHPIPGHVIRESLDRRQSDSSSLAEEGEATPLLGEDEDGMIALKWYRGPLFIAGLKFAALFFVFTAVVVGTFWFGLPKLEPEDRVVLKLPRSFADLQALNSLFQKYKTRYPLQILACGVVTYLFIQMFTLPGSMYLSILFGAAYGMVYGLLLACACDAFGSLLCYTLSAICAPPLLAIPFYRDRVETWRIKIMGDPASGKQVSWDGVFAFLVVLRIAPFPPHWIANFVAPHLGIHPAFFWASCFVGIAPVSVIHVTIGMSLDTMTSAADFHILSLRNVLGLIAVMVAVLIPVGLKRVFRKDLGELEETASETESIINGPIMDDVDVPVPAYPQISPGTYRAVDSGLVLAGPSSGDPNLDTDTDYIRAPSSKIGIKGKGKGKGKAKLLDVIVDQDDEEDEGGEERRRYEIYDPHSRSEHVVLPSSNSGTVNEKRRAGYAPFRGYGAIESVPIVGGVGVGGGGGRGERISGIWPFAR